MYKMGFTDGREIELVPRIVLKNKIVGNLVCQREIPKKTASARRRGVTKKHGEYEPGDQRFAQIALLDIMVV